MFFLRLVVIIGIIVVAVIVVIIVLTVLVLVLAVVVIVAIVIIVVIGRSILFLLLVIVVLSGFLFLLRSGSERDDLVQHRLRIAMTEDKTLRLILLLGNRIDDDIRRNRLHFLGRLILYREFRDDGRQERFFLNRNTVVITLIICIIGLGSNFSLLHHIRNARSFRSLVFFNHCIRSCICLFFPFFAGLFLSFGLLFGS